MKNIMELTGTRLKAAENSYKRQVDNYKNYHDLAHYTEPEIIDVED